MMLHDARAYPVPGNTCIYEEVKNYTKFSEQQMLQARALVEAECKLLPPIDHEAFVAAHDATQKRLMCVPAFLLSDAVAALLRLPLLLQVRAWQRRLG
jgi:hypothetical protein